MLSFPPTHTQVLINVSSPVCHKSLYSYILKENSLHIVTAFFKELLPLFDFHRDVEDMIFRQRQNSIFNSRHTCIPSCKTNFELLFLLLTGIWLQWRWQVEPVCLMVLNATFNNISVISWQSVLLVEETGESHDLSQVTDKLDHIMLYTSPWSRFELTTSVVIGTDCIGSCKSNYHAIMVMSTPKWNQKWQFIVNIQIIIRINQLKWFFLNSASMII